MEFSKMRFLMMRQWLENKRVYAFFALALTGTLGFLFLVTWHWRDSFSGGVRNGIFLIGLFVGGAVFAGTLFRNFGNKAKGMWLISIPASPFQKVSVGIIYGIVLYLVTYIATFYSVEGTFMWLVNDDTIHIKHTDLLKNDFYAFLYTYINLQLFILLGSVYFKKSAFLKTILLLFTWFFLVTNANNYLLVAMTGEKNIDASIPLDYFQFSRNGENVYVYLSDQVRMIVNISMHFVLPIILYYIIYQRFRETEI